MSAALPAILVSFVAPALVLILLFHALAGCLHKQVQGWGWCLGLMAVALVVLALPVQGLPLARWLAGFVDHWSVPLMALLATTVTQKFFGVELLRCADRQAAWVFGAIAGATLYPLALGLGSFDPYSLGWHFGPLFVVAGMVAVILQWRQNRFGVVLFLTLVAWVLRLPESGNYWDCLVDPFYFFASLGVLGSKLWRRRKRSSGPGQIVSVLALIVSGTGCIPGRQNAMEKYVPANPNSEVSHQAEIVQKQQQAHLLEAYLLSIKNAQVAPSKLEKALMELSKLPVRETPEFWVEIVNDSSYDEDHRRDAIAALFRRHFSAGTRLNRLSQVKGTSNWFSKTNLFISTVAQYLPLTDRGECVYLYQPGLMQENRTKRYVSGGYVYFSLQKYIPEDQLVMILEGTRDDEGTSVLELAASSGDPKK